MPEDDINLLASPDFFKYPKVPEGYIWHPDKFVEHAVLGKPRITKVFNRHWEYINAIASEYALPMGKTVEEFRNYGLCAKSAYKLAQDLRHWNLRLVKAHEFRFGVRVQSRFVPSSIVEISHSVVHVSFRDKRLEPCIIDFTYQQLHRQFPMYQALVIPFSEIREYYWVAGGF